jgi:threonine aldolase
MIDLYSDTRTKPTPGMRRAIAEADVGDEQAMLDPTVNALCERVADLLGKEAAVYLPRACIAGRATRSSWRRARIRSTPNPAGRRRWPGP